MRISLLANSRAGRRVGLNPKLASIKQSPQYTHSRNFISPEPQTNRTEQKERRWQWLSDTTATS